MGEGEGDDTRRDAGTGSVTRHVASGRWLVRLRAAGERKSLGYHDTRELAEGVLRVALQRTGRARGALTLAAWGARWLDRRELDGVRGTREERCVWRRHVAAAPFSDWPLRAIKRVDVHRWVLALGRVRALATRTSPVTGETTREPTARRLSAQTVRHALRLLRGCLGAAADEGLVATNVALGVRSPRAAATTVDRWTYLTASEIAAVLALELRHDQRAAITVAVYAGLRQGELWGLRWCDVVIDGPRPEIIVRHSWRGPTKAGRPRRVPLLPAALEAMRSWRRLAPGLGEALVWPAHGGGGHARGYDAGWAVVRRRAGITRRVRWHDLRHTCASHLVSGTWGRPWRLEEVRQLLGHSSIQVTERYAHLAPDSIHEAAAATTGGITVGSPGKY